MKSLCEVNENEMKNSPCQLGSIFHNINLINYPQVFQLMKLTCGVHLAHFKLSIQGR